MTDLGKNENAATRGNTADLDEALRGLADSLKGKAEFVGRVDAVDFAGQINTILSYFHLQPIDFEEVDDYLDHLSDCYNVESRGVVLKRNWFKDAAGPYLALLDTGEVIALLPRRGHYYFIDPQTRKRVRVNDSTARRIQPDALCVYIPLPRRKISARDLFSFSLKSLSTWNIAVLLLASLGVVVVGMVTPIVTRSIFSGIVPAGAFSLLWAIAVLLFGAAVASGIYTILRTVALESLKLSVSSSLQSALMNRVMSMPASFFRSFSAGEISSRLKSASTLANSCIDSVMSLGVTGIFSLLYIVQLVSFAPQLVAPALIVLALQIGFSAYVFVRKVKINERRMTRESDISGRMLSLINGMQKVRLSGEETRVLATWANNYRDVISLKYRLPKLLLWYAPINACIASLGTVAFYLIATITAVPYADFLAFTSAYGMLSAGVTSMLGIVDVVAQFRPTLSMLEPILSTEPESGADKPIPRNLTGAIELDDVSFSYGENSSLIADHLSLSIKPGEYIGICGTTGCGKSTLLRLLLGFEKPQSGKIYYDDYSLDNVNLRSLRRQFGTVLQNAQLMQGSIFQNISIGTSDMTEEEAWEAAEAACVADDIRAMPMKMNTLVAFGGRGLSGGQKQRILIARALAGRPKIVFMDEATSALDNVAQAEVSKSMDALRCTRVVIAHRLSTIRNCDRILVLDKGKIVEDGNYDTLIALNGRFTQLVAKQRLDN